MFFSSGISSGPPGMAPWTPWIDIKIQKKFKKPIFGLTLGWLYSTTLTYKSMLGSLQIVDFDWSFTLS